MSKANHSKPQQTEKRKPVVADKEMNVFEAICRSFFTHTPLDEWQELIHNVVLKRLEVNESDEPNWPLFIDQARTDIYFMQTLSLFLCDINKQLNKHQLKST